MDSMSLLTVINVSRRVTVESLGKGAVTLGRPAEGESCRLQSRTAQWSFGSPVTSVFDSTKILRFWLVL